MKRADFYTFTESVSSLSITQCDELVNLLKAISGQSQATDVINSAGMAIKCCPSCGCEGIWKWGSKNGLRRWRCKNCGKTFSGLIDSGFTLMRKRSELWQFTEMMTNIDPPSLRNAAEKLGISVTTAFTWRHRLLNTIATGNDKKLSGITEFDETFVVESRKGSREWVKWEKALTELKSQIVYLDAEKVNPLNVDSLKSRFRY